MRFQAPLDLQKTLKSSENDKNVCVFGCLCVFFILPHGKCGNAAYTHTHIYTHRLFSFFKASSRALGMPEFGKIVANTRQIMHFWETLGASSRA